MLFFSAVGDEAKRVEALSDEEIITEVTSKLRRAFPRKNINPP
jgi:monoamine oxidase